MGQAGKPAYPFTPNGVYFYFYFQCDVPDAMLVCVLLTIAREEYAI
jgi:hypothetical protein